MDRQSIKWRENQWISQNNGTKYVSTRAQKREEIKRHNHLRARVKDKVWFDSLTNDEKNTTCHYWYFIYEFEKDIKWTWSNSDSNDLPLEGEDCETFCKRMVPGSKNTQRDIKIDILLR